MPGQSYVFRRAISKLRDFIQDRLIMRKFYCLSTLVLALLLCAPRALAQDFSNKGKEFYLCFPQHVPAANLATLSIWITSDKASSGTVKLTNG